MGNRVCRRRVLTIGMVALAVALISWPAGLGARLSYEGGLELNLSAWKFHRGDLPAASAPEFGDSNWEPAYLPHTLALEPRYYRPGQSFFRGVGWYRTSFTLPDRGAAEDLLLEFDGVMARADVWLNGRYLGSHLGGFTPFAFDVTAGVNRGGANLLAVRVDNRRMEVPPDGLRADLDYPLYGGIYRAVRIVGREKIFVDDLYVTTPEVSPALAAVRAAVTVRNTGAAPLRFRVVTEIFEKAGQRKVAETTSAEVTVAPGQKTAIAGASRVEKPRLWSPAHPDLYIYRASLVGPDNHRLHAAATSFGIRSIQFTPEQGFFLNGEPVKLIGFNRHQFYPYLGNAVPDRYQRYDAQLIKASGSNFVRLSHYPQAPSFLDACDELGILVYEELPGWHYLGDADWKDLAESALREMIMRDRSRPAVILWGARINESREDKPFTDRLNATAHALDPSRPTTGARVMGDYVNFFEDVVSLNDYSVGGVKISAAKPFLLSETVGVNYQTLRGGRPARVRTYVEWHLFLMNQVFANPRCAGQAAWCLADHNSFQGENPYFKITGVPLELFRHLWHWGVMDTWRLPKDPYFVFSSQLLSTPFIHIVGNWDRAARRDALVLHNCEQVELLLNNRSLGRRGPDQTFRPNPWIAGESLFTSLLWGIYGVRPQLGDIPYALPHPPTTFPEVPFTPGRLEARCIMGGQVVADHVVFTPGPARRFTLETDYAQIFADGSDLTRVKVKLVDENNQVNYDSDLRFAIAATGPARVLADAEPRLEAGMAAFFVQSNSRATGNVTVSVSGGGLTSDQLTVKLVAPE